MKIRLENLPAGKYKIACIKAARYALGGKDGKGMGLKEAKDAVEDAMVEQGHTITLEGEMRDFCNGSVDAVEAYVHSTGSVDGSHFRNGCGLPQVKVSLVNDLNAKKIKTKGYQVFNVPNDKEGKAFMERLSKYINRPTYSIVKRGRGSRQEHGAQSHISLQHSEWIAVYIEGGNIDAIRANAYNADHEATKAQEEIARLQLQINALKHASESYKREIEAHKQDNVELSNELQKVREAQVESDIKTAGLMDNLEATDALRRKTVEQLADAQADDENGISVTMVIDGTAIEINNADSVNLMK